MAQKPSIPKGTRDFGPEIMLRREFIFDTIRNTFRKYGYRPLETPSMENLEVLTGKYGEEGDRLIYRILNSGDFFSSFSSDQALLEAKEKGLSYVASKICDRALRYDLTVPFARFVVMNQHQITYPFKRYQIQPVWRADRPQKGRYREFYQCDADVVGSDSLLFEAELIAIFDEALSGLGLTDFDIMVNNRKILSGYAEYIGEKEKFADICIAIDKLDKIGEEGVKKELVQRGIPAEKAAKLFNLITFTGSNPEKIAFLKEAFTHSPEGLNGVREMEEVLEIHKHFPMKKGKLDFNLQLARGLDYYTGTIFEVKANSVSIGSIAGGGRYDNLTGVFGLEGVSGVGISFGADRIYDVMDELGLFDKMGNLEEGVLLINFGEETREATLDMLFKLREAGISSEMFPENAKMKKQFSFADKKGLPYTLMIGAEELKSGLYQLKDMRSGKQEALAPDAIIHFLKK